MFLRYNALGLAWALMILILLAMPGSQFRGGHLPNLDKVIHIILFGGLALLFIIGFIRQRSYGYLRVNTKLKVFVLVVAYGIILEVLQGLVFTGRSIEFADMIANTIGAAGGVGMFILIYGTESYV